MLIGIEIGGTKLQIALGHPDGSIVKTVRGQVNREEGRAGILRWIKHSLDEMLSDLKSGGVQIDTVGVGFGGPLHSKTGTLLKSVQVSGWDAFELKKWFESQFSIPTYIYNDSSAAGWGEYILGSGRETGQFFYTNIGSGIGGALVLDGSLY